MDRAPTEDSDKSSPETANVPLVDNNSLVSRSQRCNFETIASSLISLSELQKVDISDALSEKDRVKFTVHTVTTLPGFAKSDFCVVRQHEEFVWLHDCIEQNEDYAGYIVST